MTEKQITKEYLETLPSGEFSIQFNGSPYNRESEEINNLIDTILLINKSLRENEKINIDDLKAIIFSDNFEKDVFYWQDQVSTTKGYTSTPEAEAWGKTIEWKTNERVSSVIIFRYELALGLIQNNSLSKACLAHEFGHVHFNSKIVADGIKIPLPCINNWDAIKFHLANILLSEFFAESIAYLFFDKESIENIVNTTSSFLEGVYNRYQENYREYQVHGDLDLIFEESVTDISSLFSQFGRNAGIQSKDITGEIKTITENKITEKHDAWKYFYSALFNELFKISFENKFTDIDYNNLKEIIEIGFNLFGIFPEQNESGIYIKFFDGSPDDILNYFGLLDNFATGSF